MSDQLALFNLIDGTPMVVVHDPAGELHPGTPVVEVLTVMPEYTPPKPAAIAPPLPAPPPQPGIALLDMVVVLPFKDAAGRDRGTFLKTPAVVVGFNTIGMALLDVGTPGSLYAASLWRLVKMND